MYESALNEYHFLHVHLLQYCQLHPACEKREIVVMMDLVLNHSSHLHPWFLEARKDRNSKYHDFYIWKEGTKEQPPEGGGAFFGGSTWE